MLDDETVKSAFPSLHTVNGALEFHSLDCRWYRPLSTLITLLPLSWLTQPTGVGLVLGEGLGLGLGLAVVWAGRNAAISLAFHSAALSVSRASNVPVAPVTWYASRTEMVPPAEPSWPEVNPLVRPDSDCPAL